MHSLTNVLQYDLWHFYRSAKIIDSYYFRYNIIVSCSKSVNYTSLFPRLPPSCERNKLHLGLLVISLCIIIHSLELSICIITHSLVLHFYIIIHSFNT